MNTTLSKHYRAEGSHCVLSIYLPCKDRDVCLYVVELTESVGWRGKDEAWEEKWRWRRRDFTEAGVASCRGGQPSGCGEIVLGADVHVMVM